MTREPDLTVLMILQTALGLAANRVVTYDENYEPPKDTGLYIVGIRGPSKVFASNNYVDPATKEEVQQVACSMELRIQITSVDESAVEQKESVLMALSSIYAQTVMESEQIRITRQGDLVDLSFIEGASAMKRFQVVYKIMYMKTNRIAGQYIDAGNITEVVES